MNYFAENFRQYRKQADMTQDEVASLLGISPQSISKWERAETYPDIALLPALANLFRTTIDSLMGMADINSFETVSSIFTQAHNAVRRGDIPAAVSIYEEALKLRPNHVGIRSDLAITLAMLPDAPSQSRAVELSRELLLDPVDKSTHTTRAALCFLYEKMGLHDRAMQTSRELPHVRESREEVQSQLLKEHSREEIDGCLRFLLLGEQ